MPAGSRMQAAPVILRDDPAGSLQLTLTIIPIVG